MEVGEMSAAVSITLQEAKERVRIHHLWHELGFDGEPKRSCKCPRHEDRNPSFSVFDDGKRFNCFACGVGGDVIDFYAWAKGISNEEACRDLLKRAGGHREPVRQMKAPPKQEQKPTRVELPEELPYSKELAQRVADSRGLRITSVEFAAIWLETVSFARVCGFDCWILYDRTRRCVEARRIDREPFPADGDNGERKVHTLRGSNKSCPVGLFPPAFEAPWLKQHVHKILLVEGGPDYLGASQIIAAQDVNILPVAMLGASLSIAAGALPYFAGRETVIAAHPDEQGVAAATRWAHQIQGAGGSVRAKRLKGGDLNEIVTQGATLDALGLF
jgi:CHC2 zinc finger